MEEKASSPEEEKRTDAAPDKRHGGLYISGSNHSITVGRDLVAGDMVKNHQQEEASGTTGDGSSKVFFSYSHKDTELVEKYEKVIRSSGNDVLRDSITLRAGQNWNERLLELIEEADVFILFWSHNSAKSEHVEEEWRFALGLRRKNFIRPIFWEDPMPEIPDELSEIHFDNFDAGTFE